MANTIKLTDNLPGLGVFNKTVSFSAPLLLPTDRRVQIKVSSIQITTRVPNIFDARPFGYPFNNTIVRVGTDTESYVPIVLEAGLYYNSAMVEAALNAAINDLHWWKDPKIPGLSIVANTVIDRFVIKIDSSKLNPVFGTQFKLDMQESTTKSQFYRLVGFLSTTELTLDGTYTSPNVPMMDTQGTTAVVCCTAMPSRLVNNSFKQYVATVSFAGNTSTSDALWPPGNVGNDNIVYSGPRSITQCTTYVQTEDGAPMVFMNGRLIVELLFYW